MLGEHGYLGVAANTGDHRALVIVGGFVSQRIPNEMLLNANYFFAYTAMSAHAECICAQKCMIYVCTNVYVHISTVTYTCTQTYALCALLLKPIRSGRWKAIVSLPSTAVLHASSVRFKHTTRIQQYHFRRLWILHDTSKNASKSCRHLSVLPHAWTWLFEKRCSRL